MTDKSELHLPLIYNSKLLKIDCNISNMIKQEAIQLKRKKIQCNLHGNAIRYKCESPLCQSPYLCADSECLDEHFHEDDKLMIAKFNSTLWESRFQEAQNVVNNNLLKAKAENLEKIVEYFNHSLIKIKKKMHRFEQMKVKLCTSESESINQKQFQSVNEFLYLGSLLERKMDKLRSKVNDDQPFFENSQSENDVIIEESPSIQQIPQVQIVVPENDPAEQQANQQAKIDLFGSDLSNVVAVDNQVPNQQQEVENHNVEEVEKNDKKVDIGSLSDPFEELFKKNIKKPEDYRQNRQLSQFLSENIPHFDWSASKVVFSLQQSAISCQKFHQRLRDKRNLLFLFIGEDFIIGSYYHEAYPSIAERFKKDTKSFIFIQDHELQQSFSLFKADPLSDSHISVSEKLLICQGNTPNNGDGLRTFQRTFESVVYFLPSRSYYDAIEGRTVTYNGVLKIKQCYVLQLEQNDK